MALVKCPECGRENVSSSALTCPDCGFGVKEHFEKNPKDLYVKETSVSYFNLLTLNKESIFETGLEDGAKGKCIEGTSVWDYYVEKDTLYVTRVAGTVAYKIVDDLLINLNGKKDGYLPEQDLFNASCTEKSIFGGMETQQFYENGSYTVTNSMNSKTLGFYKRKGNLIALKAQSTGNEANGFVIFDNCLYIGSAIKTESAYKIKELLDELNSNSFIPLDNTVSTASVKNHYPQLNSHKIISKFKL